MNFNYYREYFSRDSIGRYDMAPLYADPTVFSKLIEDIISPFNIDDINKVVAIDATGFILGASVSTTLRKGLVLVRKGGKIPLGSERIARRDFIDYTGKTKSLEIDRDMINKNENVLIVDDWVETGSQAKAAISMIEELGGNILGISSIGSDRNEKTEELFEKYNLNSIGVDV